MTKTAKPAARSPGRPPLSEADRLSETLRVRVTAAQRQAFERRGGAAWLRRLLSRA